MDTEINQNLAKDILGNDAYIQQGADAIRTRQNLVKSLLAQRKWPELGWDEMSIELLLSDLAQMDSNNFPANIGAGEREARVYSDLVARRHFRMAHGIGRSGDIAAIQPKAAGSSLIMKLVNIMCLDVIRLAGVHAANACIALPLATGMAMVMTLLTLAQTRPPSARKVLWLRIDQKSCIKAITACGFEVVVVDNAIEGDEVRTDLSALQHQVNTVGKDNILCIVSTTSCFAPRCPDRIVEIAKICATESIPHVINNAYGIQSSKITALIQDAHKAGRVDAFVQSSDKNLMVPVGGALVAGHDRAFIKRIGEMYPGRASAAPSVDIFITLLSMGQQGFRSLLKQRKVVFEQLRAKLGAFAVSQGERLLETPHNPISLAITLSTFGSDATRLGSFLFTRCVSGTRVVAADRAAATTSVGPVSLSNFGAHHSAYHGAYLTAAAAIGMTEQEVDALIDRLTAAFKDLRAAMNQP
ncbi:sec tRNA synthase [Capsaspora owczarzaki ATCC 30864]|uniref:O-phosphoseryl-tRNA(Sec) selenium transferase n=1 Tax=Capsaspora owczarzaki (strain ATCC 30864) TaxID=595528 RepID=A0A0D2UPI5_CAPO3|nr:sec tRNA synthase [Capsaspora owczarzaki ATCC 30864]KJE96926.1 sec tRNA synthase [Capsaspora owczarzaki ATCC 30864]|eukprot:XP_004343897.1 sec tRNA synthase [Capsaspora owczarzaki ATCC 30864]